MKKYRFLILAIVVIVFAGLTMLLWRPLVSLCIQSRDTAGVDAGSRNLGNIDFRYI